MRIEPLESRLMRSADIPTAASAADLAVPVYGTEKDDVIRVETDRGVDWFGGVWYSCYIWINGERFDYSVGGGPPQQIRIEALGGNDRIELRGYSRGGALITVMAGEGNDTLTVTGIDVNADLGLGDDLFRGDSGSLARARVTGSTGRDSLHGGAGSSELSGGSGSDRIWGGAGDDLLLGGSGNDRISGGDGDDLLMGGGGKDRLDGQGGNDTLSGGSGNDRLVDLFGSNLLCGSGGNDYLYAINGNQDTLAGGSGWDSGHGDEWDILGGIEELV